MSHAEKNWGRYIGNNFVLFFFYNWIKMLDGTYNAFLHLKSDI